jgi:dipeptide transport system ATP-binding protein
VACHFADDFLAKGFPEEALEHNASHSGEAGTIIEGVSS